jgi:HEAT repeat protein
VVVSLGSSISLGDEGSPRRDTSSPKDPTPTAAVKALFEAAADKDDRQLLQLLGRSERKWLETRRRDDAIWDQAAIDRAIRSLREECGDSVKILEKTVEGRSLIISFNTNRGDRTTQFTVATYRQVLDMTYHDLGAFFGRAPKITQEKVAADSAVVTVETRDGDEVDFSLITEDHRWKILDLQQTLFRECSPDIAPWADLPSAQPKSRSVEGWIRRLQDPDPRCRREAIDALQQLGPEAKAATSPLGRVLREDPKRYLRQPAAEALRAIGPDALPALEEALKVRDSTTRYLALETVTMIWERAEHLARDRSMPCAVPPPRSLMAMRARVVAMASSSLQDRSQAVQLLSAEILVGLGPDARQALPVLTAIVKGHTANAELREAAFRVLGRVGPAAAPTLLALLEGDDASKREVAAYTLASGEFRLLPRDLAQALARSLKCKNGDGATRDLIGPWLTRLGPHAVAAMPVLVEVLEDSKNSEQARTAAAAALGSIGVGAKAAIPALRAQRDSLSSLLRETVREALKNIGPP